MAIKYKRLSLDEFGNFDYKNFITQYKVPITIVKQERLLSLIAIISLLIYLSTFIIPHHIDVHKPSNLNQGTGYGAVIDCGSSGSRAFIFKWENSLPRDVPFRKIDLLRDKNNDLITIHIEPGLSDTKDDPKKASDYLEPIMIFLNNSIPQEHHKNTPVYFMATAGMRLLNKKIQQSIIDDIHRDFSLKFSNFPNINVEVITGAMEGAYSWMSLNLDRILHRKNKGNIQKTKGMIELGGASLQVTFELNNVLRKQILTKLNEDPKSDSTSRAVKSFENAIMNLEVGQQTRFELFSTTLLGFGVNNAREFYTDFLLEEYIKQQEQNFSGFPKELNEFELSLKDDCLPNGANQKIQRPTSSLMPLATGNITLSDRLKVNKTFTVSMEGSGDFWVCHESLRKLVKLAKKRDLNCPNKSTCALNLLDTHFIPFDEYSFVGLSEFYYTTKEMLDVNENDGKFERAKFMNLTKSICDTKYDELKAQYRDTQLSKPDRLLLECFKASWILALLDIGLKMPHDYDKFKCVQELDSHEINWTIGAMSKKLIDQEATRS